MLAQEKVFATLCGSIMQIQRHCKVLKDGVGLIHADIAGLFIQPDGARIFDIHVKVQGVDVSKFRQFVNSLNRATRG